MRNPKGSLQSSLFLLALLFIAQGTPAESDQPSHGAEPRILTVADPTGLPSPWAELLAVRSAGTIDGPRLVERGLVPVRSLPGWTVVGVEDQGEGLEDLVTVSLPVPAEGEILLAVSHEVAPDRRRDLSRLGRTVHLDPAWSVLLTHPDHLDEATMVGPVVQIFMRPEALPEDPGVRKLGSPWPEVIRDPWVEGQLSAVSIDTLRAMARTLQDFGTRHSSSSQGREAGDLLLRSFREYGYEDVWLFDYNAWSDNVVARKVGRVRPEEIVIIGGHYDSVSRQGAAPGADDNASGTAGVMEAARVLASGDFERTIIFIAFSGEEQGLVGSEAFASMARSQGWNVVAMINLDMIGYVADAMDLDLIWRGEDLDLVEFVREVVETYVPELPVVDGYLTGGSSDHASFWGHGYPAVFFFEDSDRYSPYIHTSSDVIGLSLNNFDFMTLCVQGATATVATLASPFSLRMAHVPLVENQEPLIPYPVEVNITTPVELDPESLHVFYRVDGSSFVSLRLEPLGEPGLYGVTIPPQEAGARVAYYVEAADTEGHLVRDPREAPRSLHTFRVGFSEAFADDFDEDKGWIAGDVNDNATGGRWIRARPIGTDHQPDDDHTPGEGGTCWVTGNGPPGDNGAADVDGGRTTLISPSINLADLRKVEVSYWLWYVSEVRRDDTFRVETSSDGGASWITLLELNESLDGWTHFEHADIEEVLDGARSMKLRFVAEDIGLPSLVEALLDDVVIRAALVDFNGVPEVAPPVEPRPPSLRVWPNPTTGIAHVALHVPDELQVNLTLHNVLGQRVRTLLSRRIPRGPWTHEWDGRSDGGRLLPAGVYWLRLRTPGEEETRRILILR